jgi:hypothetical protein
MNTAAVQKNTVDAIALKKKRRLLFRPNTAFAQTQSSHKAGPK